MPTLYDSILRQQFYLEGVKSAQHAEAGADVSAILKLYTDALRRLGTDDLSELSKSRLNSLLAEIRRDAVKLYAGYSLKFLDFLESFVRTEVVMSALIIKEVGEDIVNDAPLRKFNKQYATDTWASVRNSIMPATGEDFLKSIDATGLIVIAAAEKTIKAAFVNQDRIVDTIDRFSIERGGIASRLYANSRAMVSTAIQHTSAYVNNAVQSVFYDEYEWCSIIDGATSDICRSRNGNIYAYGEGPLPPAHPHCRSRTIPVTKSEQKNRPSLIRWLTGQSDQINVYAQSDIAPALSLEQYANKTSLILK